MACVSTENRNNQQVNWEISIELICKYIEIIFFFLLIFKGYGWLTIHLINAYYYGDEKNGISGIHVQPQCKPYIKLFINNEPVWRSSIIKNDKTLHDPDLTFDTAKILKNSTIVLQIWDAGCGLLSKKEFEFSTNGDVDSFLNQPFRENDRKFIGRFTKIEAIETMSFWLDEYN